MRPEFAHIIDPIFLAMLQLETRIESDRRSVVASDERNTLVQKIGDADARFGASREWQLSKYALCAWIDALLTQSRWEGNRWWQENCLEKEYFGSRSASRDFFKLANDAASLGQKDALEVFYVTVMLGFRGIYAGDAASLATAVNDLRLPSTIEKWCSEVARNLQLRQGRPVIDERVEASEKPSLRSGKVLLFRYSLLSILLWTTVIALLTTSSLIGWLIVVALLLGMSAVLYGGFRLWQARGVSGFPDLDQAWREGVAELHRQKVSLTETPLFLVLGVPNAEYALQVSASTGITFKAQSPQSKDAAVTFAANDEGIFLYVPGGSSISRLYSARDTTSVEEQAVDLGGTMIAQDFQPQTLNAGGFGGNYAAPEISRTILDVNFVGNVDSQHSQPAIARTVQLADNDIAEVLKQNLRIKPRVTSSKQLSAEELKDCQDRLEHVCRLIQRARPGTYPVQGVVSSIPFELVESSNTQLLKAVHQDLEVVREQLNVCCSNTVLIVGLEREPGFLELLNRVGLQGAREYRFGKGCSPWAVAEPNMLRALAAHAVGGFEDWIYKLYQSENALRRDKNSGLFSLLCKVRGKFAENLATLLADGFSRNASQSPHGLREQFLFAGCYFAAAGKDAAQQAFVRSVFLKTIQQREVLKWTEAAKQTDHGDRARAKVIALLALLPVAITLAVLAWKSLAK